MSLVRVFVVLCVIQCVFGVEGYLARMHRQNRHCPHHETKQERESWASAVFTESVTDSKLMLIFVLIMGFLFVLMFFGLLKGLIGLYIAIIGAYGLNLLVELPRQLKRYQEKELRHRQVVYDDGGWPVHPDTKERSVRQLSKRTEFCLNIIFFLAYPFAAMMYLCALCCCIKNYGGSDENVCFKRVNVIKLTKMFGKANGDSGNVAVMDLYSEDYKEEEDTKYVIDAMRKSQSSLRRQKMK